MTTDDIHNLMTELMKMLTIYLDEKTDYPPIHSPIYLPTYFPYCFFLNNLTWIKLRDFNASPFKRSTLYMWAFTAFTFEQSSFFMLSYFKLEFLYHWIDTNEIFFTIGHSELGFETRFLTITDDIYSIFELQNEIKLREFQYSNEFFHSFLFRSNITFDWQR